VRGAFNAAALMEPVNEPIRNNPIAQLQETLIQSTSSQLWILITCCALGRRMSCLSDIPRQISVFARDLGLSQFTLVKPFQFGSDLNYPRKSNR
jgi:hypothetical protein